MSASSIPRYQLYGESTSDQAIELAHIERLRERSQRYDWVIDAHTHVGLNQIAILLTGRVTTRLDGQTYLLEAPATITIPPAAVHAFDFEENSTGFVIMLDDGHLDRVLDGAWIRSRLFDGPTAASVEVAAAARLSAACAALLEEQHALEAAHGAMALALVQQILIIMARERDGAADAATGSRDVERYREFRHLVEDHFAEQRSVSWYASNLHTSESSLNRACQAIAGTSAFEHTQRRLELEAKRRLIYSTETAAAIAVELGFSDASYFSRFFRRRTGTSPASHRRVATGTPTRINLEKHEPG